jgi:GT2 family glycosyltransferase
MKLGIVLPTYNRRDLLGDTLNQLLAQKESLRGVVVEIVVVVDGSTDGTLEMIRDSFRDVHVVAGTGDWYYTKSMNEGFRYMQQFNPDYMLTLNDDIILGANYLAEMLSSIEKVPANSIIGCLALTPDKPHRVLFGGEKKYIRWRQKHVLYLKKLSEVNNRELTGIYPSAMLPGRGMLIPNQVLVKLNYFDEFFKQYHSDSDFCLRAAKAGHAVYVSWDARLYGYVDKTAEATSYIKTPLKSFLKSFTNIHSRNYIPQKSVFLFRHGIKVLWPLTMLTFFLSTFSAYLFKRKLF